MKVKPNTDSKRCQDIIWKYRVILNKAVEEKRTEGSKEEQDNNIVGKNDQKKNAYIYPPGLQTLF